VDTVRFGLAVRALRRKAGWTQSQLGLRVGASSSAVSRIERGRADVATVRSLERVANELGARLVLRIFWQGEALDRLLDSEHARLVEWTVRWLQNAGWEVIPEVTFQVRGERGSIDVLARHGTGPVLVIEVKSVVPDIQALLSNLDRKVRLAADVARERGWPVRSVSQMLILPADRTARRRVEAVRSTTRAALPDGTVTARNWVKRPMGQVAAVVFVPNVTHTATRHRVRGARSPR
jgi:transcriptional regulator with XRE-family HTH domain